MGDIRPDEQVVADYPWSNMQEIHHRIHQPTLTGRKERDYFHVWQVECFTHSGCSICAIHHATNE